MVQVFLSWCWIGISAFLCGIATLKLVKKITGYEEKSIDMTLLFGLCFLTVYAQTFSLFYKVGALATLILLGMNVVFLVLFRKDIGERLRPRPLNCRVAVLALFAILVIVISSTYIQHYDTYLYHGQSIRWVEEYGVVPGLGNLHNRLAYNSAIFSLQALFSMKFLLGTSLHTLNGFIVFVLGGYALTTFKVFQAKKFYPSDIMRLVMLFSLFYGESCFTISSCGSDTLALGVITYIFTKWLSYNEEEAEVVPYALLCLLGVYAVTVKLSVAMIVLLTIQPAIQLIKKKAGKQIAFYILLGLAIAVPFLARNVIISGYLVYPYPELDLFNVDWKMPEYTLLFDRNEIKAWGWGLNDVYLFDTPIKEWFPVWIKGIGSTMRTLFYTNLVLLLPVTLWEVYKAIKKKNWTGLLTVATIIACMALWFVGSPLPRYGSVFLVLLPAYALGEAALTIQRNPKGYRTVGPIALLFVVLCLKPAVTYIRNNEFFELKSPDYFIKAAKEAEFDGQTMYYPAEGDHMGYHVFPSTPYVERLELIEFRGESYADGFKMKDAYKDAYVTTYGEIDQTNVFDGNGQKE